MLHIYADGTSIYDPLSSSLYLITPKLKLEWGKAGALEFAVPSTHAYYNKFQQLKTVVTAELDGTEIFRGRVLSIERDFNNTKSVSCEGDLAYLVDSVQKAEKYNGTAHALFRRIIQNHNQRVEAYKRFAVGEITIENRSVILSGQSDDIIISGGGGGEDEEEEEDTVFDYKQIAINSMADEWNNTYDYIKSCIIDYCGGYLRTRRVGSTTYLDLLESAGSTATQEIRFGENLLDLTEEVTSEDLFTVLVPLGDENLTIASVNGGSDELEDAAAVALYGRIVKTNVFQNVTSPETLKENGWRYLEANIHIPTTITVKAIDLTLAGNTNVSAIRVGDRVHINSSPHRLVEYLICTEIEYDFTNPENTIYTFGNPKQTLTQRYREDKRAQSDIYGDGIGSYASSGIGATGLALSELSKKNIEKFEKKIFKEWIDIDPDNPDGIGSLGGLYRLYSKDKKILENEVGIKFDASAGNISLYSLSERINDNTQKIEKAEADFTAKTEVIDGRLTAVAAMQASYKTETDEKIGRLELTADELGSKLTAKVDVVDFQAEKQRFTGLTEEIDRYKRKLKTEVGIDLDSTTGNLNLYSLSQRIDSTGNEIESARSEFNVSTEVINGRLTSIASMQASYKSETDEKIGKLELSANELGSKLTAKVDVVDFQAEKQRFVGLTQDIDEYKRKLKTEVGIDLDSTTGNLNLYSMSERITENTTRVEKARADFTASTQVIDGRLTSIASMQASYKTETDEKIGSLELRADSLGTSLNAKVDVVDFQAEKQRFTGFSNQFDTYKRRLKNDVGIDLDATTGNVNISSLSTKVNTNGQLIAQNSARITTTANDLGSQVNIVAQGLSRTDANVASIQVKQTNLESSITLKADKTVIDSELTDIKGRLSVTEADIKTLKARTITASEIKARIAEIDVVDVRGLNANSIYAKNGIQIGTGTNNYVTTIANVNTKLNEIGKSGSPGTNHYHEISVNSDGTVTLGKATTSAQSFKISDTKAYRDGVSAAASAVTITELDRDENFEDTYDSTTHVTTVHLQAVASNGKTKGANIPVSGAKAYRDGMSAGAAEATQSVDISDVVRRVVTGYGTERYNIIDHTTTVFGVATASNGKTKDFEFTTGTQAYRAGLTKGQSDVTIESLTRQEGKNDFYNSVAHTTTIYVQATASNGEIKTQPFATDETAYEKGRESVTVSVPQDALKSSFDMSNWKMTLSASASAGNGKTASNSKEVSIASYFKPEFDISLAPASSNPNVAAYKYYNVTVVAKNSKGWELNRTTRQIADATMYNRGYQARKDEEDVVEELEDNYIHSIYRRAPDDYYGPTHNTYIYVQAKDIYGNTQNQDFLIDGRFAYEDGYGAGYNAGKSAGGSYETGYRVGYNEGWEAGRKQGEKNVNVRWSGGSYDIWINSIKYYQGKYDVEIGVTLTNDKSFTSSYLRVN